MKLKQLLAGLTLGTAILAAGAVHAAQENNSAATSQAEIQLIRNATLKITYGDTTFLIDPMLAEKGAYPGFEGTYRSHLRNPMIDLPLSVEDIIAGVDAIIVTHEHSDHINGVGTLSRRYNLPVYANRATMAAQVVDPDPQYDTVNPPTSGEKAGQAGERYRKDAVKKPAAKDAPRPAAIRSAAAPAAEVAAEGGEA